MTFDFQAARSAGYSDNEIVQFFAEDKNIKFDVSGAIKSGYTPAEVVEHLSKTEGPKSTDMLDALKQGASNVASGIGETLEQYGAQGPVSNTLKKTGKDVAPANYSPATVVSEEGGFTPSNAPRALTEMAPGLGATIAAGKLGARVHPLAGLTAGAGTYALMTLGRRAKERAAERTAEADATPTTEDKATAAGFMVPEAALGAVGVSRFIPGFSKAATNVGAQGAVGAAKRLGTTTAVEAGVGAGQNAIGQTGRTIGTEKGVHIDPYEVVNSGLVSGATGGALAGPRAIKETAHAAKFREFGGDNADASAAVANRIQIAAGDKNLSSPKVGFRALKDAEANIHTELGDAVGKLDLAPSSQDATNALSRVTKGKPLQPNDLSVIGKFVDGTPDATSVMGLVRQATVISKLKSQGEVRAKGDGGTGTFKGGVGAAMERGLRPFQSPVTTAAAGGLGVLGLSGQAAMFAPAAVPSLAALGGTYLAARALDKITGARSPAKRFVDRFSRDAVPVRASAPLPQSRPTVTATGPKIPLAPTPWGSSDIPMEPRYNPRSSIIVDEGMAKIAKQLGNSKRKEIVLNAMPSLAALAARDKLSAAEPAPVPMERSIPKDVAVNARSLVSSLSKIQKLKQQTEGANQAEAIAASSPLIADVGGLEAVRNPQSGKRAGQLVSAANAIKKLTAAPEEATAEAITRQGKGSVKQKATPAPVEPILTKVTKTNGRIEHETNTGDYVPPMSPYAHLPAAEAARAITDNLKKAGVPFRVGETNFLRGTHTRLDGQRKAATSVANAVPGIDAKKVAAVFEGSPTRAEAKRAREFFKQQFPQAATAFDTHFSDAVIKGIWKR